MTEKIDTDAQPKTESAFTDLETLKLLYKEVKTALDKSQEPNSELGRCLVIVEQLQSSILKDESFQAELEKFVWEEFVPGLTKRVVKVRTTKPDFEQTVQNLIFAFAELFKVSLQKKHKRVEDMASAARDLFDPNAKFYVFSFQHEFGENANRAQAKIDLSKFDEEERKWRENLKVGDNLDAIKEDKNANVEMWARGEVTEIIAGDESQSKALKIRFLNDIQVPPRIIPIDSIKIAPQDKMCAEDLEWRANLKKGDMVDALDRSNKWYLSTIITPEERPNATMPLHKVGFRVYQPEGDKEDEMGKFFGYSATCDEFIGPYTVRIQKPKTFTQEFDIMGSSANPKPEESTNKPLQRVFVDTEQDDLDTSMLSKPGDVIFATQRAICKSITLVDMINKLGSQNVFEEFLTLIGSPETTLETLFYLNDCLGKCSKLLHKSFVDNFLERYRNTVEAKLLSATETQLRSIKFQRIEDLINTLWDKVMIRKYSGQQAKVQQNYLNFDVGHLFLRQNFLEKRIDGAKLIQSICNNFKGMANSIMRASTFEIDMRKTFVQKLQEKTILQEFFSKQRVHAQLVSRSEGLLRMMLVDRHTSDEDLEMIWTACVVDESIALELYKVFNEMSSTMGDHELDFFIRKLVSKPDESIRDYDVDLIQKLLEAKNCREESFDIALDFLFKLISSKEEPLLVGQVRVSKERAAKAFSEALDKAPFASVVQYLQRFQQNLIQDRQTYLTISILNRFIKVYIPKEGHPQSKRELVDTIEKEFSLLPAILDNTVLYLQKVREVVKNSQKPEGMAKKKIIDDFPHDTQVKDRLTMISTFLEHSSNKMSHEQIGLLWDALVSESLLVEEQELFYVWLQTICDQVQAKKFDTIEEQTLIDFFKEKTTDENTDFSHVSLEGYQCIQSFFILTNSRARRLIVLEDPNAVVQKPQTWTSYSSDTGAQYTSYSFKNDSQATTTQKTSDQIEIQVRTAPSQMEGINVLWKIAVDCRSREVSENVNNLLLQLHTNVDFGMENQIPLFEEEFLASCKRIIKQQLAFINARDEKMQEVINDQIMELNRFGTRALQKLLPQEERRIIRCLQKVKMLIQNSEKDGLHGLIPHSSLVQSESITVKVYNQLKQGTQYRSTFEIVVSKNITVFELKKMIGQNLSYRTDANNNWIQETPVHPCSFKIGKYGDPPLKDSQNGCTLNELNFKDKQGVNVQSKGLHSVSKAPLLNDDKTALNARANFIFTQMFEKYSVSDPDQPDLKIMTMYEIVNFIEGATTEKCNLQDSRVASLLNWDSDADGKLTVDDFLKFYFDSVHEKETTVRQNLVKHNFRSDLKQAPVDGQDDNILQTRKSYLEMPRYKMSNDQEFLDLLFQLFDQQYHVSATAETVCNMLCTSPQLFWQLLELKDNEKFGVKFDLDQLFDDSNINRCRYVLQIVEANLILDFSKLDPNCWEAQLRKDWFRRFLQVGGFEKLTKLFSKVLNSVEQTFYEELKKEGGKKIAPTSHVITGLTRKKKFLDFLLRLYKVFVWAGLQSETTEENALLLFKRSSDVADSGSTTIEEGPSTPKNNKSAAPVQIPFLQNDKAIGPELPPEIITQESLFGKDDSKATEKKEETLPLDSNYNFDFQNSLRFKQIVKELRETQFGNQIVQQINFQDIQSKLLNTICLFVISSEYNPEEHAIIESAFDLWSASIIKNNELIQDFYSWTRTPINKHDTITDVESFFKRLMFCPKGVKVRESFRNSMIALCEHVKNENCQNPLHFILELLRSSYPKDKLPETEEESKIKTFVKVENFFHLFRFTIMQLKNDDSFDFVSLFDEIFTHFKEHPGLEKENMLAMEDQILVGFMALIKELLTILFEKGDYQIILDIDRKHNYISEIFYQNLYYVPGKTRGDKQNKCKSRKARLTAYQLLYKYIKTLEAKEMAEFLENYLWPFVKDLSRPSKWYHSPSNKSRSYYSGINNLGNVCYMISMLQQFYWVPQFRYLLLTAIDEEPENLVEYRGEKNDDNLTRQLQKLFGFLELTERSSVDPTGFCLAYKDLDGNPTNVSIQCDAQEFLNFFFDRLENKLASTSQKYLLQDIFRGMHIQQLVCNSCGHTVTNKEYFYTLSVEVKNRRTLEESLQRSFQGDEIEGYNCAGCNQKVNIQKRPFLAKAPNTLIVHLQRIVFSFETFNNEKVNSRFEFPFILDLKQHSFKEKMLASGKSAKDFAEGSDERSFMEQEDDDFYYRLVGVNIHRGTADHGHYWSIIDVNRGDKEPVESEKWASIEKDTWRKFDDDENSYFIFKELEKEAFGGDFTYLTEKETQAMTFEQSDGQWGKNAYMLIYEKRNKSPIRQLVDKETETLLPFREVSTYIPNQISQFVKKDNVEFVTDRQVYNETFFYLCKLTLNHIGSELLMKQHKFDHDYAPNFHKLKSLAMQLGHKVMLDFLSHFNENGSMQPIVDATGTIGTFSDTYVNFTTQPHSVLLQTLQTFYIEDSCQNFLNIMMNCPSQTARKQIGRLTANLINKSFRIWGILKNDEQQKDHERVQELYKMLDEFMTLALLKLQEKDCQKNWSRLEGYFQMLCDIGCGGQAQTEYLLEKPSFVTSLVDLILGNKSPKAKNESEPRVSMGGTIPAPFGPLVALASHLIRCMHTKFMTDDLPKSQTFAKFKNEVKLNQEPHHLPGKYEMSEEDFEFFSNPDFFDLVVRNDYSPDKFAPAIAHVCFGDKKLSKKVCWKLLKGVVTNDYNTIKPYLVIVESVTLLKDHSPESYFAESLQRARLEWIFGQPFMSYIIGTEPTRLGLSSLYHNIKSEPFIIVSTLYSETSGELSILNLLHRYQGRMDTHVVNCLDHLLRIIASDEEIQRYFAQLPALTYQHARYSDWIGPYLQSQLNSAGSSSAYSSTSKESIVKVISNFEVFEQFLKKIDNPDGLSVKQEIISEENVDPDQHVIQCNPKPYMILKVEDETHVNLIETTVEEQTATLMITMLRCSWAESKPTGFTNLGVPPGYWAKYTRNGDTKSAAGMLQNREKQMQDDAIKTSSSLRNRLSQAQASDQAYSNQPEKTDSGSQSGKPVIQDGDEQWQNINADNYEAGYKSDKDDKDEEAQKLKDYFNTDEKPSKESTANNLNDSFDETEWRDIAVHYCDDLVYKLLISNTTDTPIIYKIKMSDKKKGSKINLHWPRTSIKGALDAGETAIGGLLSKLVPSETDITTEVEKLNFEFTWVINGEKLLKDAQKVETKKPGNVAFQDEVKEMPYVSAEIGTGFDAGDFSGAMGNDFEKACLRCTFLNPIEATICSCCESELN